MTSKLARLTLAFSLTAFCVHAEEIKLRASIFPDAQNVALFIAQDKGFFQKRGLDVEIAFTSGSSALREGLANGSHQIVHAAVDNKGLKRAEYKVLPAGGCPQRLDAMRKDPANAFSMLYPPCTVLAEREGFRSLGAGVDVVGPYQASGIFVMRPWAKANADTLVKYIQALIEGYRYAADPANKTEAAASLSKHLNIDTDTAVKSLVYEIGPKGALAKDVRFNMEGFKNALSIRSEIEGGSTGAEPAKYLDMSYYERALSGL